MLKICDRFFTIISTNDTKKSTNGYRSICNSIPTIQVEFTCNIGLATRPDERLAHVYDQGMRVASSRFIGVSAPVGSCYEVVTYGIKKKIKIISKHDDFFKRDAIFAVRHHQQTLIIMQKSTEGDPKQFIENGVGVEGRFENAHKMFPEIMEEGEVLR